LIAKKQYHFLIKFFRESDNGEMVASMLEKNIKKSKLK